MEIAPELYLIVPLAVFSAYVIYGVSGFGSALINVSILAHFLPLTIVVPLSLLLDFSAAMMVGFRFRSGIQWKDIGFLVPFMLAGIATGVFLLVSAPREYALMALGSFLVLYALYSLYRPRVSRPIGRGWGVPAGLLGGTLSGMFGTGGPMFVIYMTRRGVDPMQLKATLAAIISLQSMTRIVAYTISGLLLQIEVLIGALLLAPVMWLGLTIGNHLHVSLPSARVFQVIAMVLMASGAALIVRAVS